MENTITEKTVSRILFLASDPSNAARLHLGKELQEVRNKLASNTSFEIKDHQAVKPDDVLQTIISYKPQVVHFSGHGLNSGELCFEDELGQSKAIPPEALASLFSLVTDFVKCVIVNTCYSERQAKAIAQYVPVVIGTWSEITDTAAIKFSTGFYTALDPSLSQSSLDRAYKLGCIAIQLDGNLDEQLTPVLIFGSPEIRFSSEVDTAFSGVTNTRATGVKMLIRGLSLKGIGMQLHPELVKNIIDNKILKLEEYNNNIKEYEDSLKGALRDEFPLSSETLAALSYLQNGLALSNPDVETIKNKILSDPKLDSAYSWYDRGRGQYELNNIKQAIDYYSKAIEKNTTYSGAYYERGFCYNRNQQYDLALADFSKAIECNKNWELGSNLSAAYLSRGHTYFSLESTDTDKMNESKSLSLQDWTKSIELNPQDANVFYNRGLAYEYFNKYEEAIADYKKSLEIDTTNTDKDKASVAAKIVKCYSITGNTEEARKWTKIGLEYLNNNGVGDVADTNGN